jgi:DNA-binding winged helix-turn-helix (wHTH) protein/alpha-beta hydrolase superfamily lysophospholipase
MADRALSEPRAFAFGPFRLEPTEGRLTRGEEVVALRPKVFDTLLVLVRNAGRLVEKDELMAAVWPDAVVEEGNLAHNVSTIRKALGGGRVDQSFIETVPKRGYRFVAEVTAEGAPAVGPAPRAPEPADAAVPEQRIGFTTAADGVRIAFATSGAGAPLVKAANWLNHLEFDWRSPIWRHLIGELSKDRLLVRYDERGNGLSDWDVDELSLDAFVADLESVVDALDLERFALLGISQGCAVSIVYAHRHPERVSRMVLHGGYATGWRVRAKAGDTAWREGLLAMTRDGWGRDTPAFRQVFASLYIPSGTPDEIQWWSDLQRVSTSPDNAVRLLETLAEIDVRELLPRVSVPTLVTHCRGDAVVPFASGEELAKRIPGARFVPLESANHLVLGHEPAWPVLLSAMRGFLAADEASLPARRGASGLDIRPTA